MSATLTMSSTGGYDSGYESCPCFWGSSPGSLVQKLDQGNPAFWQGKMVLDIGCGEGKNAAHGARNGAKVIAIDVSPLAIRNALRAHNKHSGIAWAVADARYLNLTRNFFDVVIAYGVCHCLPGERAITDLMSKLQLSTRIGGMNVLCSFNDRHQELFAHPGFHPTLLPHDFYVAAYHGWTIIDVSDSDLVEAHPHNGIVHTHSLTRIIARRES